MSQADKERVIAELADIYEIATPKKNAMLILADKAYDAGYIAAKEDAAKIADRLSNGQVNIKHPQQRMTVEATAEKIAAAIRKLEPKG